MAITVHVVTIAPCTVDATGNRIDKNSMSTAIADVLRSSTEWRIVPDADVPNSASYPDLKTYLIAEAAGGYQLQHLDQTYCITYKTS